jgi:hypothetical protein
MRSFNILGFNRLGRLPRLLLAFGVLAMVVAAGAGMAARPADAAPSGQYQLRVTWETVKFTNINDCSAGGVNCNVAEVYGWLHVDAAHPANLDLGEWGGGSCEAAWAGGDATGPCRKTVTSGTTYKFNETSLCYNVSTGACYVFGNESFVDVYPGQHIGLQTYLWDYDPTVFDADDLLCWPTTPGDKNFKIPGFTLAELQTLNRTFTMTYNNPQGHGGCEVTVRISRAF